MENGLFFETHSIDTYTSLPQGALLSTDSCHYKEWSPKNLNNLDTTFSAFILQAAKTCWHYKTFRIIKNISAKLGIPAWMWNISISTKFWFLPKSKSLWSFTYEGVLLTRSNMGMLSPWIKDMIVRLTPDRLSLWVSWRLRDYTHRVCYSAHPLAEKEWLGSP